MTDPIPAIAAVRSALATSRHAELLFDAATALLGAHGHLETAGHGSWRRLFRRDDDDSQWLVPWPLLALRFGGRMSFVSEWMQTGTGEPVPAVPQEQRAPRLRGLGPAELEIRDGPHQLTVTFGDAGTLLETSRSAELGALGSLLPAAGEAPGSAVERLAQRVAALPIGSRGPARLRLPVPLPSGVQGNWFCARRAMRRALFAGEVPASATWIAADGIAGTAIAQATSREGVLEAWLRQARRAPPQRPVPKRAQPPIELPPPGEARQLDDGSVVLAGPPAADVPWPRLAPDDIPVAAVELRPVPAQPPPLGRWLRLLGERGDTVLAALRTDADGCTIVGEDALAAIDLQRLDEGMDAAAAAMAARLPPFDWPADRPPLTCAVHGFSVRAGSLLCDETSQCADWDAGGLDGDRLAARVLRVRKLR